MNKQKGMLYLLLTSFMLLCLGAFITPTAIEAQGDPLPTPTPFGTPAPTAVPPLLTVGGTLILQAYNAPANSWTVVQWQDANDNWHDVSSWSSQITDGYVGWWVAPENYGTGPFRWLLLDSIDGEQLSVSESFNLPGYAKDVVLIEIKLED